MVLALPPRPPVDPDDVNTPLEKYSTRLFQILYVVDTPGGTWLLKFDLSEH